MLSNEKNSKNSSSNNYFRRKGVVSVFKTIVRSETLFPEKMKKMEDILGKAKVFSR